MDSIKKRAEIRLAFEERGEAISEWADRKGFKRGEVYAVLSGRIKGVRGQAHRIAVSLGLKESPQSLNKNKEENDE